MITALGKQCRPVLPEHRDPRGQLPRFRHALFLRLLELFLNRRRRSLHHLTLELDGGQRVGPDAEYVDARDDFGPAEHKHAVFLEATRRLLGPLAPEQLAYDGCGIRPKLRAPHETRDLDFILREQPAGFLHLLGIESPGVTAALALAEEVADGFLKGQAVVSG